MNYIRKASPVAKVVDTHMAKLPSLHTFCLWVGNSNYITFALVKSQLSGSAYKASA